MPEILIIDDDESLTELLETYISRLGYSVKIAPNGIQGLNKFTHNAPDLVVLDITMPAKDGWTTLEQIRKLGKIPVVMLTARSEEQDVLRGFSLGADDYVTKPFSFAEIAARIQAVLARSGREATKDQKTIQVGDLRVDFRTRQVFRGKKAISLTPTEFKLLTTLMDRAGEVVSPDEIVRQVWGAQYAGEVGHVRRYVWHLRNKIEIDPKEPRYVHNDHGFGYRFQPVGEITKSR